MTYLEKYAVAMGPVLSLTMPKEKQMIENTYRALGTRNPYGLDRDLFSKKLNLPKIKPDYSNIPIESTKRKKARGFGAEFKNKVYEYRDRYPKLMRLVEDQQLQLPGGLHVGKIKGGYGLGGSYSF